MITAYNPRRMPLVTVTTFRNPHDAVLARAVLEDEGLKAFVTDGDLKVAADDVDRAEGILNRIAGLDVAERSTASAERAIRHPEQCPHCGSPDIRRNRRLLGFTVCAALLFALGVAVDQLVMTFYLALAVCIFFLVASPYRCADCGHRW
jgi:predicted RNA-binding Zn-ribbon protein involved in translation (DUF1610 family)